MGDRSGPRTSGEVGNEPCHIAGQHKSGFRRYHWRRLLVTAIVLFSRQGDLFDLQFQEHGLPLDGLFTLVRSLEHLPESEIPSVSLAFFPLNRTARPIRKSLGEFHGPALEFSLDQDPDAPAAS